MEKLKVKFSKQYRDYTCGSVCLEMIFDYYGKKISREKIMKIAKTTKRGTGHLNMINAVRTFGFYCYVHENSSVNQIKHFIGKKFPVLVNYIEPDTNEGHYAVVIGYDGWNIILNDPWNGKNFKISFKNFKKRWFDYHTNNKLSKWIMVISNNRFSVGKQYEPLK